MLETFQIRIYYSKKNGDSHAWLIIMYVYKNIILIILQFLRQK